ncbi:MAG: NAD(P)/FAD-dependent oxidoreductase [Victivallales bacterium]|nr:NAD(P)/FAD-dependent oxidoreductase [Victivallales bacterium]
MAFNSKYDVVVIGGGLSGLAAGIRLAHFGKRVCVFERHTKAGGLNSWYERGGRVFDTGLHAFTNFASPEDRSAPLNRILRRLRIRREELRLCPQSHSTIRCGTTELRLDNDFASFQERVAKHFPEDREGFEALLAKIESTAYAGTPQPERTAREVLAEHLKSRRLQDLLCLPVFFFGNAWGGEMPFGAFATLFKSIFVEGFARPQDGMQPVIELLTSRLQGAGAELHLGCGVTKINLDNSGNFQSILDNSGQVFTADCCLSTIGAVETRKLLGDTDVPVPLSKVQPGEVQFVEALFELDEPAATYGLTDCMQFIGLESNFAFRPMSSNTPTDSLLVCVPDNYIGVTPTRMLRLSAPVASLGPLHSDLCRDAMPPGVKSILAQMLLAQLGAYYPRLAGHAKFLDLYTPYTFRRFTGHANGAIYGSPDKFADGATGVPGLALAGTDQGLLGIVGALLSGVLAANRFLANR